MTQLLKVTQKDRFNITVCRITTKDPKWILGEHHTPLFDMRLGSSKSSPIFVRHEARLIMGAAHLIYVLKLGISKSSPMFVKRESYYGCRVRHIILCALWFQNVAKYLSACMKQLSYYGCDTSSKIRTIRRKQPTYLCSQGSKWIKAMWWFFLQINLSCLRIESLRYRWTTYCCRWSQIIEDSRACDSEN